MDEASHSKSLHSSMPHHAFILPGLPDELALLCLARLPLTLQALCRCVSRAWRHALQLSSIQAIRGELGITEELVFMCISMGEFQLTNLTYSWLLLDPLLLRCNSLPPPPLPISIGPYDSEPDYGRDPFVIASDVQGMAAGTGILVFGIELLNVQRFINVEIVLRFDVVGRKWCRATSPIGLDRHSFASATLEDFVYVAGGHGDSFGDRFIPLKSAERFNIKTSKWEMLPDMNETRDECSGFVMDGCFYVTGGFDHNSAEFFDPSTGVWTQVPNMWPKEMGAKARTGSPAPSVAVVKKQLYALRTNSTEIRRYEKLTNRWVSLGYFPAGKCNCGENFHRLMGVGEELWVIVHDFDCKISILASKPESRFPNCYLAWRLLPFKFKERFKLVPACAVIKV